MKNSYLTTLFSGKLDGENVYETLSYGFYPSDESLDNAFVAHRKQVAAFADERGITDVVFQRTALHEYDMSGACNRSTLSERKFIGGEVVNRAWCRFRKVPNLRSLDVMLAELEDIGHHEGSRLYNDVLNMGLEAIRNA